MITIGEFRLKLSGVLRRISHAETGAAFYRAREGGTSRDRAVLSIEWSTLVSLGYGMLYRHLRRCEGDDRYMPL
jgi:hypothetical protein